MRQLVRNNLNGKFRRRVICHCILVLALSLFAVSTAAQNLSLDKCEGAPESPRSLNADETVNRDMRANELHVYEVTLSANQFVQVIVEQKAIDVIARLIDPNGGMIVRDSPNGKFGPERISAIAGSAGTYRVEVCTGQNEPSGAYALKLDGPRAINTTDERRVIAESLLRQGGEELKTSDGRRTAIERYNSALTIWREIGDTLEQGYTLCAIGEVHRYLAELDPAISSFTQALSQLRAAHDIAGQAYVQNAMGAAHRDYSINPAEAIADYEGGIALRQQLGDRWGEGHLRNNLGFAYNRLGQNLFALQHYNAALTIWQALGARDQELNTLNNIATANVELGNTSLAEQQFKDLLRACEQERPICQEPTVRNGLGMVYDVWGQPNQALEQFNLALSLLDQLPPSNTRDRVRADVLDNLGMLYTGLNDPQAALEKFDSALQIRRQLGFRGGEAVTRSNIGYAQVLLGHEQDALAQLDQALTLSQDKNARFKGYTLMRMGILYASTNQPAKALESYTAALTEMENIGDARGQAMILDKIAELNGASGAVAKARETYQKARKRWRELRDLQGEAGSLYGLAKLERRQNNLYQARDNIIEAVSKVERLRTSMTNDRFRRTYFEAKHDYYALEIDVRMQLYFQLRDKNDLNGAGKELESALFAAERSRARNLLELLTESRADIRKDVNPRLLEEERERRKQLSEKLELLQRVLAQKSKDEKQKKAVQREVNATQREVSSLQNSLNEALAKIRDSSSRYAALTQPEPLKPAGIKRLLDSNTCLLQYALGEDRSYLWFVTPEEIVPYKLPGRTVIEAAAAALQDAIRLHDPSASNPERVRRLRNAEAEFRARARELSNLILSPVAAKIGNKRLVIVADGTLQYVPFSALPVPGTQTGANQEFAYLITKHEVLYEPSASALALLREDDRPQASRTVAVFADPVFSAKDERITNVTETATAEQVSSLDERQFLNTLRDSGDTGSVGGSFRFARLKNSRVEADAIAAVAPDGSSIEVLDFDANRARVLGDDLKQFRIVHFATHGILNVAQPELSGLVFSLYDKQGKQQPGVLRLSDIYNLNLPVDLVVLSACQTAIGEQLKSEGLMGLTRGFMYAGTGKIVASLWNVDDVATAQLMKRFYTYMLRDKKSVTVAFRQAQLDMIAGEEKNQPAFFWAGFVLQGDWR